MEFPRHQILDLSWRRSVHIGKTINLRVDCCAVEVAGGREGLSYVKGKCKHELVIVGQLEDEVWAAICRVRILFENDQLVSLWEPNARRRSERTWINSIGAVSPKGRDADILVQGKALGAIWMDARVRLLLIMSDAMDTVRT